MTRYAIISKGLDVEAIRAECERLDAHNIVVAYSAKQVFCEMDDVAADILRQRADVAVKPIGKIGTADWVARQRVARLGSQQLVGTLPDLALSPAVYGSSLASILSYFYNLRAAMSPPITGVGSTTVVIDSGIRKSHVALRDKVVYEANFSSSPTAEDVFDHGTGVAYLICGGRHAEGEESGIAPGASVMNLKVLEDDGTGSTEAGVLAVEEAINLRLDALEQGLPETAPMLPNIINLSVGAPDDGDPDNPLRVACRAAVEAGLAVVAAAGNDGPNPGTVMVPAVDPKVAAVGAVTFSPFQVWEQSSRGPTMEGVVKPDLVFFGVSLLVASARDDNTFVVKSGTSFASPCVCGASGLMEEATIRLFGQPFSQEQAMSSFPLVTRKPEGAPAGKDNDYGYGMPSGDLIMRAAASQAGLGAAGSLLNMMLPLMMMGTMAKMIGNQK